jgi:hypothetical protein
LQDRLVRECNQGGVKLKAFDQKEAFSYRIIKVKHRQPVRVFAQCIQNKFEGEDFDQPLFVDVCVSENKTISTDDTILGLLGSADDLERLPFVVRAIGEIDFGFFAGKNPNEFCQLFSTNLLLKTLDIGNEFSIGASGECIYRFKSIVQLKA